MIAIVLCGIILSGCASTKISYRPTAEPWKLLAEGCQPVLDGKGDPTGEWICIEENLDQSYQALVNLQHDKDICNEKLGTCQHIADKERSDYETKLDAWHRKWYVVGPIGIAIGVVLGIVGAAL